MWISSEIQWRQLVSDSGAGPSSIPKKDSVLSTITEGFQVVDPRVAALRRCGVLLAFVRSQAVKSSRQVVLLLFS